MRVLLTLVVACALLALASSARVNLPQVQGQAQAQAQQSCTAATINAIRTTAQKLTAVRACINSKAKVEKLTLHHAGPRVQWTSWQLPGMDPVMNQLGFNAYRYPIAYKSHAKNAAKLAAASTPPITLTPLTPTENACWDGYPVSESGDYNRYNCISQHRAKYFEGLAVKHKADKSFAKGYAAAKRMGTAKLTAENDVFADSMGAGIYYCPDAKFVRDHGDTYSECTFTDASPLKVFNIDEHTPDGKENLEWMEAIRMFGETAKSKATIRVTSKKFKNRFTNQGEVESVFNFSPTGNIAVRYRAASNTAADQAPYYVLKRFDLKLCKLTGTAAAAPVTTTRRRML